jgi:hypothetical protein
MKTSWIWTLSTVLALPLVCVFAWKRWHRRNEVLEEARRRAGSPRGVVPVW